MNPIERFLRFVAAPTVLTLAVFEACVLWRRRGYDWRAFGVSIFDFVGRIAVSLLLPLSIATPLMQWAWQHRLHHASNPDHLDANDSGVLIVFDRLFGTYRAERDDLPCRYGLVHPVTSCNPLTVEFAQWASLVRDLARARSLRAVLGHLFGPPGWAPDGAGFTTEALRSTRPGLPT